MGRWEWFSHVTCGRVNRARADRRCHRCKRVIRKGEYYAQYKMSWDPWDEYDDVCSNCDGWAAMGKDAYHPITHGEGGVAGSASRTEEVGLPVRPARRRQSLEKSGYMLG